MSSGWLNSSSRLFSGPTPDPLQPPNGAFAKCRDDPLPQAKLAVPITRRWQNNNPPYYRAHRRAFQRFTQHNELLPRRATHADSGTAQGSGAPEYFAARTSPERAWPSNSSTRAARPQTCPRRALEARLVTSE